MKYSINKILNKTEIKNIYFNFIKFSPQKNIFCSQEILEYFFEDLDLYTVSKSDKVKSFVYLQKKNENLLVAEPFIYSGILNHPQQEMKSARYNNEVFKINELIVNEIFSKYKKISLNLPFNFIDTRPFLWFNYGKVKEKKFHVTPSYTSIIDIDSKDKEEIFSEIDDVKKRDIKKALSDKDYKISNKFNLALMKHFYENTMKKNNGLFDRNALTKIFDFIKRQNDKGKVIQVTTYYLEKPIYSVLFLNDDSSSCYLYGSGDIEIKNRYAGSLALWKAIEKSLDLKLSYIDLEGINSPYRGEYKLNFGGNIQTYYNINF